MCNTIVGAGAASRYGPGSGSDQEMRLRLRNTDFDTGDSKAKFTNELTNIRLRFIKTLSRECPIDLLFHYRYRLAHWALVLDVHYGSLIQWPILSIINQQIINARFLNAEIKTSSNLVLPHSCYNRTTGICALIEYRLYWPQKSQKSIVTVDWPKR
jgi:hypothetical protein